MKEAERGRERKNRDIEGEKIKTKGYDLTELYFKEKEEAEKTEMNIDVKKDISLIKVLYELDDILNKYIDWLEEEVEWDKARQYELPSDLRESRYGSSKHGEIVPPLILRESIRSTMLAYKDTQTKLHHANKVLELKKRAQKEQLVCFDIAGSKIYLKYVSNISEVQDSRQIVNRQYNSEPFLIGTTDSNKYTVRELRQFLIGYKNKELLGCNGKNIELYFSISPVLHAPRPGNVKPYKKTQKILLEDDRTLASYGITENMAVHVVCN